MGIDVWLLSSLEYLGLCCGIWGQATDRRGGDGSKCCGAARGKSYKVRVMCGVDGGG